MHHQHVSTCSHLVSGGTLKFQIQYMYSKTIMGLLVCMAGSVQQRDFLGQGPLQGFFWKTGIPRQQCATNNHVFWFPGNSLVVHQTWRIFKLCFYRPQQKHNYYSGPCDLRPLHYKTTNQRYHSYVFNMKIPYFLVRCLQFKTIFFWLNGWS